MSNPSLLRYIQYYWHQTCANQLFSVITLMNLGYTCLFHKGCCTVFFSDNEQNAVTLLHSARIKHAFLVKMEDKTKSLNQIPIRKISLQLLYHILLHISTRSLLDGYTENVGNVLSSGKILTDSENHVRYPQ